MEWNVNRVSDVQRDEREGRHDEKDSDRAVRIDIERYGGELRER